jgi:hypothetical protein
MKRIVAAVLAASVLLACMSAYGAVGGLGKDFGRLGKLGNQKKVVVAGCASPTAPDGSVDLSQCSNAFYVSVILF